MASPLNPYAVAAASSELPLVAELVGDSAEWTLDYKLEIEDLLRWNDYFQTRSPAMRRQFYTSWVLIGLIVVFTAVFVPWMLTGQTSVPATIAAIATAFIFWLAYPRIYRGRNRRMLLSVYRQGANANVVGRRRISLTPQYVAFSTPHSQTITRWTAVESIVIDGGNVFIILSPLQAIVVPHHAFTTAEQSAHFTRAAESLRQLASQAN